MKGFTLIELMICTALIIIILSIGVPGFGQLVEKYQANTAAHSLKQVLRQARANALEKETSITVCPTLQNQCINDWTNPITAFIDDNYNRKIDGDEYAIIKNQPDITTGYWQKKRANTPYIIFSPQGHAFSTATTFLYCPNSANKALARLVVINFQGRIRVNNYLKDSGTPHANVAPLACRSD